MNWIYLIVIFLAIDFVGLKLEDENGVPFDIPESVAFVVLDNQSCALCNKYVDEFISSELKSLPVYTLIDSKKARSVRFMELERHEDYLDIMQRTVLFPAPEGPAIKAHFRCESEKTPFMVVIAQQDTLVFGHSWFDGSTPQITDNLKRLRSLLSK